MLALTSSATSDGGRLTKQFFNGTRATSAVVEGFLGAILGRRETEGAVHESRYKLGNRDRIAKKKESKEVEGRGKRRHKDTNHHLRGVSVSGTVCPGLPKVHGISLAALGLHKSRGRQSNSPNRPA